MISKNVLVLMEEHRREIAWLRFWGAVLAFGTFLIGFALRGLLFK